MSLQDSPLSAVQEALTRLDARLERAVALAEARLGPPDGSAPGRAYRGLVIDRAQVQDLLAQPVDTPLYAQAGDDAAGYAHPLTQDLARRYGLTLFDLDALFIALAPELDRRYERLYAYLQDDVRQTRPSVALALDLLCAPDEARTARLSHFAPDAPLLATGLLRLERSADTATLLGHWLRADEQVVALFAGLDGLTPALAGTARLITARRALHDLPLAEALRVKLVRFAAADPPIQLYLQGPPGAEQAHIAEALAAARATGDAPGRLLLADLATAPENVPVFVAWLARLCREAAFTDAVLYVAGVDALADDAPRREALHARLAEAGGVIVLSGAAGWLPSRHHAPPVLVLPVEPPPAAVRLSVWQDELAARRLEADPALLAEVARRFELTPTQIAAAAAHAGTQARWQGGGERALLPPDLFAAIHAQSATALAALADRITPRYGWDDLILPEDALAQLHELVDRVRYQPQVMEVWGFGRKHARGQGVAALFAGPSGTGKTMAAEIIAGQLGLLLYRIDLSSVVSKYIGETEKNLKRVFDAARQTHAILFFDEADALFGQRSEVKDSHDRYANIEISFLLQQMESYDGVSILATNLRENLDQAFVRRLTFAVHFPFPDEASRQRIWQGMWTAETPLADDVDTTELAAAYRLSGGNIKNVALAAAHLAAADGGVVTLAHVRHAVRRELQKLGQRLTEPGCYDASLS